MSLQKIAEYLFPEGNFAQIRATSPDQRTYNIDATKDLVQNQPAFLTPFAPVAAAGLSLPYDAMQAAGRITESDMNRAMQSGALTPRDIASEAFGLAYARENPLDSLIQRTQGATLGLADRLKNAPEFLSNLIFTPIGAGSEITNLPNIDITDQLNDYYEKGEMMDNVVDAPKSGILQNIDFGKLLSLVEILSPTNLRKALAGTRLGGTVSNLFQAGRRDGLGPRSGFLDRTPGYTGQLIASDQYDPITKTNRFDRAKTLFGQSRTLMDYIQKKKEQRARRAANRASVEQAIKNQQDAGGSVQTSDSYSGIGDVGATGANFSGDFATDSASYDL